MGYDWESHKETCHRLYIREGWSLDRIMAYLKTSFDFTPSRRAFQAQFRRWDFPLKTKSHCHDDRLQGRIKELWEQNISPNQMIQILVDEGFEAGAHEIMTLRLKNRWLFRGPNNERAKAADAAAANPNDQLGFPDSLLSSASLEMASSTISLQNEKEEGQAGVEKELVAEDADDSASNHHPLTTPSPVVGHDDDADASEPAGNQSDKNKKKRNRFKKDASGAIVRYPSEMTIDDARRKLGLDKSIYRSLRVEFQNICAAMDVRKKSAGSDKWETAKKRLLHGRPELYHKLWTPEDELESKQAALDIICMDVAKRMRSMDSRMSVAQVKNALGMNPQEARDARVALNEVLIEAGLTTKPDSTPTSQQWDDLRRLWGSRSAVIKRILGDIDSDPSDRLKVKALEIMSRDTLKRLRDSRAGRSPKKQQQFEQQIEPDIHQFRTQMDANHDETGLVHGPRLSDDQIDIGGDGLSPSTLDDVSNASYSTPQAILSPDTGAIPSYLPLPLQTSGVVESSLEAPTAVLQPRHSPPSTPQIFESTEAPDMHLHSTVGQPLLLASNTGTGFLSEPYVDHSYDPTPSSTQIFDQNHPASSEYEYAVYFRMHPSSTFIPVEPVWVASMYSKTVQELRRVATDKMPGIECVRIEGAIKGRSGKEVPLVISSDEQLSAYFSYTQGETPIFTVSLMWTTGDAERF